jgi:O-antigen ligase
VAVALFFMFAPEDYVQEISTIGTEAQSTTDDNSTASHRYYLWATGMNMFLDNPVFGVGAQNFPWRAAQYQPTSGDWPAALLERSMDGVVSHSTWVDILAELGLTGVTLWVVMIGSTLLGLKGFQQEAAQRKHDPSAPLERFHSLGLAGGLIAFLASALTISVPYYPYPWYLIGLSLGLLASRPERVNAGTTIPTLRPSSDCNARRS